MQRNSVPRVIGLEGKGIPMTNKTIKIINEQGEKKNQPEGLIFGDINNLTTILDLEPCAEGEEDDPNNDDDNASDRSYLPNDDDSMLSGDYELNDEYEDQGVDRDNDEDPGVGPNDNDHPGVIKEDNDPLE
jgi:hypothetical protein